MAKEDYSSSSTIQTSPEIDGNALAARALARFGVTHMFGVVGIPVTSLAIRSVSIGIRLIAFHTEQSAGYAASAYGYLTRKPGVLLTVSGPGCVHGLAGLSNAQINTWPMIMISGSSHQSDIGKGDFQELDQIAAVQPFAKLSRKVKDITDIPRLVKEVLESSTTGRPGGCYLDLPTDVLHQTLSELDAERLLLEVEKSVESGGGGIRGLDVSGIKNAAFADRAQKHEFVAKCTEAADRVWKRRSICSDG